MDRHRDFSALVAPLGAAPLGAALLALALLLPAGGWVTEAQAGPSGKDRFTADLGIITTAQFKNNKDVPERDKPRTAKCLAQAIAADIPEADAARLSDIFEQRAPADKALETKWLTISKKDSPARYSQVMAQINKLCPDVGPYVEPVL